VVGIVSAFLIWFDRNIFLVIWCVRVSHLIYGVLKR
jgi:hypothetical protein